MKYTLLRTRRGTAIAAGLMMNPSMLSQQVVVGFDFSPSARAAIVEALTLAEQMPSRVVHILCVIGRHTPIPGVNTRHQVDLGSVLEVQEALDLELSSQLANARIGGRLNIFLYARIGDAAEEILALAQEVGADRIILGGTLHAGSPHVELGTITTRVLRDAGCTVELARPRAYDRVDLLTIVDAPQHKYNPPHRYSYEDNRLQSRPRDWPLY